jgi:hypothetical protein
MDRLDKHARGLFRPAFERYGQAWADLLRQWPAVAGEELARISRPERLSKPTRNGETVTRLVVRCSPGAALLVEHDQTRIVERINVVYGFRFVDALKVVAGDLSASGAAPPAPPQNHPNDALALKVRLRSIGDDRLREALLRLGQEVLARSGRGGKPRS